MHARGTSTAEGGNDVDRDEVLRIVHETAAEVAASNGHEVGGGSFADSDDNLIVRYGFSSIDALEYLLVLEEKFRITLEDEDLTEELLSSTTDLTNCILELQRRQSAPRSTT
jgi:acyl carrier protein